jgi:hypothetical protein
MSQDSGTPPEAAIDGHAEEITSEPAYPPDGQRCRLVGDGPARRPTVVRSAAIVLPDPYGSAPHTMGCCSEVQQMRRRGAGVSSSVSWVASSRGGPSASQRATQRATEAR